jgi:hypothetical protein
MPRCTHRTLVPLLASYSRSFEQSWSLRQLVVYRRQKAIDAKQRHSTWTSRHLLLVTSDPRSLIVLLQVAGIPETEYLEETVFCVCEVVKVSLTRGVALAATGQYIRGPARTEPPPGIRITASAVVEKHPSWSPKMETPTTRLEEIRTKSMFLLPPGGMYSCMRLLCDAPTRQIFEVSLISFCFSSSYPDLCH